MKINLNIPNYTGGFTDVFWEADALVLIKIQDGGVELIGNLPAIHSIAMQMLYYACNNLPCGTHVHYDSFFCGEDWNGMGLILEVAEEAEQEIYVDEDEIILSLELPAEMECGDRELLNDKAKANVTMSYDSVAVSANRDAYFQIAKQLLGMCFVHQQNITHLQYSNSECGCTWKGASLQFTLDNTYQGNNKAH